MTAYTLKQDFELEEDIGLKHGEIDGEIYFHGELLENHAPEMLDNRYYTDFTLEVSDDDIGYWYEDQNGGEGPFYSLVTGDYK